MSSDVTTHEYATISVGPKPAAHQLSIEEADLLTRLSEKRPGFCTRGFNKVTFGSWCGVVGLGRRMLEVLPKVDKDASDGHERALLISMLQKSGALPFHKVATASQGSVRLPLLEIFVAAYFDSLFAIAKGGLLRRYEVRADDLQVVRGRLALERQFGSLANRADILACRFDELTADNIWNQILKAALRSTRTLISSPILSRQWVELMGLFDDVADVRPLSRDLDRLRFDRHAARYRTATTWARWILRTVSPDLRSGAGDAPALLFNMNEVFEAAVAKQLASQLEIGDELSAQDKVTHFGSAQHEEGPSPFLELIPDLIIRRSGDVVLIADTKWKMLPLNVEGIPKISPSDVYQLYAYAATYGCPDVVLIAPLHAGLKGMRPHVIRLAERGRMFANLRCVLVDVRQPSWDLAAVLAGPVPGSGFHRPAIATSPAQAGR